MLTFDLTLFRSTSLRILSCLALLSMMTFPSYGQGSVVGKAATPDVRNKSESTVEAETILRLQGFNSCAECPAYDFRVFQDGTSKFLGHDAVRRLGPSGSALRRNLQGGHPPPSETGTGNSPRQENSRFRPKLDELLTEIAKLRTVDGPLSEIARKDGVETAAPTRPQRLEVTVYSKTSLISEQVTFFSGPRDRSRLTRLVEQIQDLHQDRRDFDPMPAFVNDKSSLLTWTQLWPWASTAGCHGEQGDIYAVLYRDGRIAVRWHRLEPPTSREQQGSTDLKRNSIPPFRYKELETKLSQAELKLIERHIDDATKLENVYEHEVERNGDYSMWVDSDRRSPETQYVIKHKGKVTRLRLVGNSAEAAPQLAKALIDVAQHIRASLPSPGKLAQRYCETRSPVRL